MNPDLEHLRAIEAVLLVAHDPVAPELLAQLLERSVTDIERWCHELAADRRARWSWRRKRSTYGVRSPWVWKR